jgi:Protein of unknown function (DUF3467)
MENQPQENQLNIELSEEMADGTYSNLVVITHGQTEFVLDFINIMPNNPKAKVKSRVILSPQHAKRLLKALGENITRYEKSNGVIKDIEQSTVQFPMKFGGPNAEA